MKAASGRLINTMVALCGLIAGAVPQASASLPPDPNNAALLYYQAFLLCPPREDALAGELDRFLASDEPTEKVRDYVGRCKPAVALADDAVRLQACDWGIQYSRGIGGRLPQLVRLSDFTRVLQADAQMRAVDGDFRGALDRCLMMRRFARQIRPDTLHLYYAARQLDSTAVLTVGRVLGRVSPDAQTLRWLKDQLAPLDAPAFALSQALRRDFEMTLQTMRTTPGLLKNVRERLVETAPDDQTKQKIRDLSGEALIERAGGPYEAFLNTVIRIMDSNIPPAQAFTRIETLKDELKRTHGDDPVAGQVIMACADQVGTERSMKRRAVFHLFRTAIEVYLVAAQTGHVPQRLSEDWPRDPLSGDEFDYEVTREGFILRSPSSQAAGDDWYVYTFRVHDPNLLRQPEPGQQNGETTAPRKEVVSSTEPGETDQPAPGTSHTKVVYKRANDLDAIVRDTTVPVPVRQRAKECLDRMKSRSAQGLRIPEPMLIRVTLCRTALYPVMLNIVAVDQDWDVAGIRIKELYIDPSGQTTSLAEGYPVPIDLDIVPLLHVTIRDKGQRKDPDRWEAHLLDRYNEFADRQARRPQVLPRLRPDAVEMPPVWMSEPRPGRTRVFVALYDRRRHESQYVEVENLLAERPVDPLTYQMMWQTGIENP